MVVAKYTSASLKQGVAVGEAWGQDTGRERSQHRRLRGGEQHNRLRMNCRLHL